MKYNILFVCLGNICRSSAAEEVMRVKLQEAGLANKVNVDSAGLIDYHEGELSDHRMRMHAAKRGYHLTHRSRPIRSDDFERFDFIIGMDDNNIRGLERKAPNHSDREKIHKMTEFLVTMSAVNVPDPYYGGDKDFEYVLDLLEDACEGLIDWIRLQM